MATATTPPETAEDAPPASGLRPYLITVDVYHQIIASGAFGDKSHVFLWNGQLVEKVGDMTKNRPHVLAVNALDRLLGAVLEGRGYFVEQDQPLELGVDKVPEPDLKCVRGTNRDYAQHDPTAADCPLVVEVAESSLKEDEGTMLRGYAAAGIPTYWVVNLPGRRIDVHTRPSGPSRAPSYAEHRAFGPDEQVPVVLDGRELGRIAVRDVLP